MRFIGEEPPAAIVMATNAKAAASMLENRTSLTSEELLCWLGLLFYMANDIDIRRHKS